VASHLEAVAYVRRYAEVPVARRFATVLTSAAGYPLDKTYYQTVKGMVGPIDILTPGGDIIIASACSEGMGSAHYIEAQRRLIEQGAERFLETIKAQSHALIDEWQTEMQLKPMRLGSIHLYTEGLTADVRALTGINLIGSIEAAVAASVAKSRDRAIAVIPEGPYVVPVFRPDARAA
jgi:nickel-dependent lactate racemase